MERKAVHLVTRLLHHRFRPMQIIFPRPASYLEQTVSVIVTTISLVAAIQVGIIFRTHVTAASPTFIAHTDVFHTPRLLATVLLAQLGHRAVLGRHVFHPLRRLLHRAAPHIHGHIRLALQQLAQVQEFMCTETVVLHGATPVVVHHTRTILFGADTVHPMIFIGKTTSRPTQHGYLQVLQGLKHIVPVTARIGNS